MDNLGFFYLSAKTKAVDTEKEAGVEAVEKVELKFRQSRKLAYLINQKVNFPLVNTADTDDDGEEDSTGGSSNTGSDNNPL